MSIGTKAVSVIGCKKKVNPAAKPKALKVFGSKAKGAITYPIADPYLTNPIARASETMQRCSAELFHGEEMLEAAE